MLEDGYSRERLIPVENKTVVTNPRKGARNNRWLPGPREDTGWSSRRFPRSSGRSTRSRARSSSSTQIFPEGILIPKMYVGKNILHLPTVKTHGHSTTTGAVKNAFGGLLKEVRHYAHKYIHEVLVDLLYMQKELHTGVFCGHGRDGLRRRGRAADHASRDGEHHPGERRFRGHRRGRGEDHGLRAASTSPISGWPTSGDWASATSARSSLAGDDVAALNLGFKTRRSFVIWGDQMIRKGFLRPFERLLLHSPLVVWAPFASNVYHDMMWYPTIGKHRVRQFMKTDWGALCARDIEDARALPGDCPSALLALGQSLPPFVKGGCGGISQGSYLSLNTLWSWKDKRMFVNPSLRHCSRMPMALLALA